MTGVMQTAVIARLYLSVRPSVTLRCFVQINEYTTVRLSASNKKSILVSGEVKFILIFAGDNPQRGR